MLRPPGWYGRINCGAPTTVSECSAKRGGAINSFTKHCGRADVAVCTWLCVCVPIGEFVPLVVKVTAAPYPGRPLEGAAIEFIIGKTTGLEPGTHYTAYNISYPSGHHVQARDCRPCCASQPFSADYGVCT